MSERITCTFKWFNGNQGFGFISREDGPDVFVHYTAIMSEGYRNLNEGQMVEFTVENGPKGLQAANVVPLNQHPNYISNQKPPQGTIGVIFI